MAYPTGDRCKIVGFRNCFKRWFGLPILAGVILVNSSPAGLAVPISTPKRLPPLPQTTRQPKQATQTPDRTERRTQLIVNGRKLPILSLRWQEPGSQAFRIGISDFGFMQALGVELLNTNDATRQPVQWFSPPTAPGFNLPILLFDRTRYIDITDLAHQLGWQVQETAQGLQITSSAANVLAVRQSKQSWGDRIVIDLDRPTPWQVDQQSDTFILTLDAKLDPRLSNSPTNPAQAPTQSSPDKTLPVLLSSSAPNQTQLRLGIPLSLRPRVWSLSNPNRIIVDVRPDSLVDRDILWAEGLRWRSQILSLGTTRFPVVWLQVNPRQAGLSLRPIVSNSGTMTGTAPLPQTAKLSQAVAAINGGFFNRNNQLPLGAVRRDGHWLSGPILGRGAIAWNETGDFQVGRLTLQETLMTPSGQRIALTHLNSGYAQPGIARYTPDWGSTYTPITDNEQLITIQNNQVTNQQTGRTNGTSIPIPANGYLLVVRSNQSAANALSIGTIVRLESLASPAEFNRYPQIVAAGPLLLQNRQIVLDPKAEQFSNAFALESASRSAIGVTADGFVLIVAVHNSTDGKGASLMDIAQLMQQLGAIQALNLDGGSSTTLYLGGQLLDRPAQTVARVHNGIGVFIRTTR